MELSNIDLKLWEKNVPDGDLFSTSGGLNNKGVPTLTPYLLSGDEPRPAIIVCPGGSFQFLAEGEGKPIAEWLNQIGLNAFVLNYRVAPFTPFTSTKDAVRAIQYVRYHAHQLHVDPDKIGMIGFSAGGYITSFVGTHFDNGIIESGSRNEQMMSILFGQKESGDPIDETSSKLNAMILCYGETAPFSKDHAPPDFLLADTITRDEMIDFTSNHKYVTINTPPTFLWVTATDHWNFQRQNLLFAQALNELNLAFDLHIFSDGPHALGLGEDEPTVSIWPKLCENWLQSLWGKW